MPKRRYFIEAVFEASRAIFTDPSSVVNPQSYEIPTPSAAKGMFGAVLHRLEFGLHIQYVAILPSSSGKPRGTQSLMTNGVKQGRCNVLEQNTQRHTAYLTNVSYRIGVEIIPGSRPITKPGHNLRTYEEIFIRRLTKGQCFTTPYMGQRECPADVRLATPDDVPIGQTRSLGPMSYIAWSPLNYVNHTSHGTRVTQPDVRMLRGQVNMQDWVQ